MIKSTYGTGCFAVLNTGTERIASRNRLLTTIAYQLGGKRTYALEGALFIAGAAVQWLRDELKIIPGWDADSLALKADPAEQVYLVPAFTGLGAPYWDADARGAIFGLTRGAGAAEIARATLEAVGYQTRDLVEAMRADWPVAGGRETVLRVDGGMAASDFTMQFLADMLASPVDRPASMETTALGAAYLAGLTAGLCPGPDGFAAQWRRDRRFEPAMDAATRARKYAGWRDALSRTLTRR
jgi:glycerol kinase